MAEYYISCISCGVTHEIIQGETLNFNMQVTDSLATFLLLHLGECLVFTKKSGTA